MRFLDELLPHLAAVEVTGVERRGDLVSLAVQAQASAVRCPACGQVSARVHGRYQRRLVDSASCGRRVELRLTVRRFQCDEPLCPAVTFAEQVEGVTTPYARFTVQAREALAHIGLALAGRAGARLSARRDLGFSRGTVRRYARAAAPGEMLHGQWQHRCGPLDEFKPYLQRRLAEGCGNAAALCKEIRVFGFAGSYAAVRDFVRGRRTGHKPSSVPAPSPGVRQVTGWLARHPGGLDHEEREQRAQILECCPELHVLAGHVRAFAEMMVERQGHLLDEWITAAQASGLKPPAGFARGLTDGYQAVRNGLSLPHSSGAVEGNVNRIKMLKRQMYGRAGFDLLRKRVLLAR